MCQHVTKRKWHWGSTLSSFSCERKHMVIVGKGSRTGALVHVKHLLCILVWCRPVCCCDCWVLGESERIERVYVWRRHGSSMGCVVMWGIVLLTMIMIVLWWLYCSCNQKNSVASSRGRGRWTMRLLVGSYYLKVVITPLKRGKRNNSAAWIPQFAGWNN